MSSATRSLVGTALTAAILATVLAPAAAALDVDPPTDKAADPPSPARQRAIEAARSYFTDVELINQFGKPMRLYTDLLENKVVIINSMYTSCTAMCPLLGKSLEQIQAAAGDRMGKDVYILSLTVDPDHDTPERLRKWGETFHAEPGWFVLTGEKDKLEFALKRLGQYTEDPENHQGILILGNERTGLWKKAFGLANPADLLEVFDSVLNDTGKEPAADRAASRSGAAGRGAGAGGPG